MDHPAAERLRPRGPLVRVVLLAASRIGISSRHHEEAPSNRTCMHARPLSHHEESSRRGTVVELNVHACVAVLESPGSRLVSHYEEPRRRRVTVEMTVYARPFSSTSRTRARRGSRRRAPPTAVTSRSTTTAAPTAKRSRAARRSSWRPARRSSASARHPSHMSTCKERAVMHAPPNV